MEIQRANVRPSLFSPDDFGRITLVVDVTSSMAPCLPALSLLIPSVLVEREGEGLPISQMSLLTHDDHYLGDFLIGFPPATSAGATTENLEELASWLAALLPDFGDDHYEAMACACKVALADFPGEVWLITDGLPHGAGAYPSFGKDNFPEGCPCSVPISVLEGVHAVTIGHDKFEPSAYSEVYSLCQSHTHFALDEIMSFQPDPILDVRSYREPDQDIPAWLKRE